MFKKFRTFQKDSKCLNIFRLTQIDTITARIDHKFRHIFVRQAFVGYFCQIHQKVESH